MGKAAGPKAMTASAAYRAVSETRCEGCYGSLHRAGSKAGPEKWGFQAWWCLELEVEENCCKASAQGCEPFHERAMHVQGEARVENREGIRHEETQGHDQLSPG